MTFPPPARPRRPLPHLLPLLLLRGSLHSQRMCPICVSIKPKSESIKLINAR